jgi:hypothetical protein
MYCRVQVSSGSISWSAVVRAATPEDLRLEYSGDEGGRLAVGARVELAATIAPIGPLQAMAAVDAIWAGVDPRGQSVECAQLRFTALSEPEQYALAVRLRAFEPLLVVVDYGRTLPDGVRGSCRVLEAIGAEDVLHALDQDPTAILLVVGVTSSQKVYEILTRVYTAFPGGRTTSIVCGMGTNITLIQSFVDDDRIFYVSHGELAETEIRSIVAAAFATTTVVAPPEMDGGAATAPGLRDVLVRLGRQRDLGGIARVLTRAGTNLLRADIVHCLRYDPVTDLLTAINLDGSDGRSVSAAGGLVGFVARTGRGIDVETIDKDPRYDREADNPTGIDDARAIAEPILAPAGRLLGVVVVMRAGQAAPFGGLEQSALRALAYSTAAPFGALIAKARAEARFNASLIAPTTDLFREEALQHHSGASAHPGDLLRASPMWLRITPWLVSTLLVFSIAFMAAARLRSYASGPATISARRRVTLLTEHAGVVRSLHVLPGDRVCAGDVIADIAEPRMDGDVVHALRARTDGLITSVRALTGQRVAAGDHVATAIDERAGFDVVAAFPVAYHANLRPGMALTLRIRGFIDLRPAVVIDHVGESSVGAQEAYEYLGLPAADASTLRGPVILLRASLPAAFMAGGRTVFYQDGMAADAEVVARSEPMINILIPGLRGFMDRWRGHD